MSKSRILTGLLAALTLSTLAGPLATAASAAPAAPAVQAAPAAQAGFVVGKAEFNRMFPNHNAFYTYASLTKAMKAFPAFAHTGGAAVRNREAAAFLANVSHETGGLKHIVELDKSNYDHYCEPGRPYGCPAGKAKYYGRGPIQLSWNYNYKAAGDALGIDLLHHPDLVQKNPVVAWKTALWFWMRQTGSGSMTGHRAMVSGAGFGQTVRSINGAVECDGRRPDQVRHRVAQYDRFARILHVAPGKNKSC
ncbi:chitinase [Streptomyces sp. NPDC018026]|uniref:chitinase n=1 Tax=Streptomyces sp. NPDC018026 TaxID=3365031 RepID=UPI00379D93AA